MNEINLITFDELESTNSYALKNINSLGDRGVILAKTQTQGRGRLNRSWISNNPGNLYFSIVLKPTTSLNNNLPIENLTQYMSVILAKFIEEYGIKAQIKWPNDVLINGKKIAGILAESSISGQSLNGIVLGIGINLNSTKEELNKIDQPATSLNIELGQQVNTKVFLDELLNRFFACYDDFLLNGFIQIKPDYISRCNFLGKTITISNFDKKYSAVANDINDDGSLLIEKNNKKEDIRIGDILC